MHPSFLLGITSDLVKCCLRPWPQLLHNDERSCSFRWSLEAIAAHLTTQPDSPEPEGDKDLAWLRRLPGPRYRAPATTGGFASCTTALVSLTRAWAVLAESALHLAHQPTSAPARRQAMATSEKKKRKECEHEGCCVVPVFNFNNESSGRFCKAHRCSPGHLGPPQQAKGVSALHAHPVAVCHFSCPE